MYCLLLFVLFSLPMLFKLTNPLVGETRAGSCTSPRARLLHSFLLGVTNHLVLHTPKVYAALTATLFYLVSHPEVYGETRLLGLPMKSDECPGYVAIGVHAFVFMGLLHVLVM